MIKIIFINLFLFSFTLFASQLNIDEKNKEFYDFEISMFQDKSNSVSLKDIVQKDDFEKVNNHIAKGYLKFPVWYHLKIKNHTNKTLQYKLILNEVFHHHVEFYLLKDGTVVDKSTHGMTHTDKDGHIQMSHPKQNINLKPKENKELYIKVNTANSHTFSFIFLSENESNHYYFQRNTLLTIYFTFIVSLLLYNLFLYISLKEISYLYYVLFGFAFGLSQTALYGYYPITVLASIDYIAYISALFPLWAVFHLLFSRTILHTKSYSPRIDTYVKYSILIMLSITIITLFNPSLGIELNNVFNITFMVSILILSFLIYKKGNKTAGIYFIAQFLFLGTNTINGFLYLGILDYTSFTRYGYLIGSIFEILLFSFTLAYRTNELKKENEKNRGLVDEYSKLSFLGQTVINIYHQWKFPANNIYNSINYIETAKEFKDENLESIMEEHLEKIKKNVMYLKDTSTSYLEYYKGIDQPKTRFNLKDEIESILKLHSHEFEKIKATTTLNCDNQIELYIQKNILTNIIIILVENSINVFKQREIKKPKLEIVVENQNDSIVIKVADNAGGIKLKKIEDIFEKNHSVSDSTGLGLFLAKDFLLPKIDGEITVEKYKDGALFSIMICER